MGNKKTFLAMLIILILITMGAAWASDNVTTDDLSSADSDLMSVENVDDAQKDNPVIKENLTSQKTEETVQAADSESNQKGEILGVTRDDDVLGASQNLRALKSKINSGNTIYLENDYIKDSGDYGDSTSQISTKGIVISSNKVIYGNNHKIDAGNGGRIFHITDKASVTFYNLTFIGGKGGEGGAIYAYETSGTYVGLLSFYNCVFESNTATSSGGAIYTYDSSIIMQNTNFTKNHANSADGGALCLMATDTKKVTYDITNCNFIENTVNGRFGALYVTGVQNSQKSVAKELNLINCTFKFNNATKVGGAVGINRVADSTLKNITFIGNSADNNGGAIHIVGNNVTTIKIYDSKFINSSSKLSGSAISSAKNIKIELSSCSFEGNKAASKGLISFDTNTMNIDAVNCNFTNNEVTSGDGGALYIPAITNLGLQNCKFKGNVASGKGGAIYYGPSTPSYTMDGFLFDGNTAGSGGAIYFAQPMNNLNIKNSIFINNKATATSGDGGSAIYLTKSYGLKFTNLRFENNSVAAKGGVMLSTCGDVYFKDCDFIGNNATAKNGAAIYFTNPSAANNRNITIEKCTFDNNQAFGNHDKQTSDEDRCGGAIYFDGNNHKLIDNNFTNNRANGTYASGGAIYSKASNVYITNNGFIDNYAWWWGGAFMNAQGTNTLEIRDSKFTKNTAFNAAAVDIYETPNSKVINCLFDDNIAGKTCAALYMNGLNGLISYCNFTNNVANESSAISYTPQGTNNVNATKATIEHCNFINNKAVNNATVRFDSCEGNIKYCNFINNTAGCAGAIYVHINKVTIDNCKFIGNNATSGNGGAILSDQPYTTISNSNFTKNYAKGDAGAVYLDSFGGKIIKCNFTNNIAEGNGGAIVLADSKQGISNSNFIGNDAENGGAVYVSTEVTNVNIDDSTFTKNTADNGGAVYCTDSNSDIPVTMSNDNFINNTAVFNGGAVYYKIGSTSYRDYNSFNNEGNTNTDGKLTWDHNSNRIITTSLFSDNKDYLFNVTAMASGNNAIRITITVPRGFNRQYTMINITVVNKTGDVIYDNVKYPGTGREIPEHWNVSGDTLTIRIPLTEQALGEYNLTLGIMDNAYDYKEAKINYTVIMTQLGAFTKLQKLIDEAIANATAGTIPVIYLDPNEDYSYEELDRQSGQGQINITSAITIMGNGAIIDAKNCCRIFDITADNVTINRVIFYHGNATGNDSNSFDKSCGGAILWTGSHGLLKDSSFRYNNAEYGGAVFVRGNLDTIDNGIFEDNNAVYNGGAIDWNSSNGNLTNSYLHDNDAKYGGAVFVGANSGTSHIYNTRFERNTATERGGAVDWYASSGDIILSRFTDNNATYGGAVFVGTASNHGTIVNSTFISNHASANGGAIDWNASYGTVDSSHFYDNTALNGGAIFVGANGAAGKIISSVFEGNNATNGRGGAVDWYASAGEIEYSNFTDNNAAYGGAVFVGHEGYGGNITNSRFIKNTASVKGGAVDWNATSGSLRHSYFEKNSADYGGALFVGSHSTSGSAFNNTYVANHAEINGGAIDLNTTGGFINGSRFYNNTAAYGGAIFVGSNTTSGHIVDSLFDGNNATQRGGAVDWYASSGEIYNSNFNNNWAPYGGAVFVGSATNGGNIRLSNFTNNRADENGGAIDWNASNGRVKDSLFKGNEARFGGAIYVGSGGDDGHIIGSEFTNNNAVTGGAVYLNNVSNIDVSKSEFNTNTADEAGAIYVSRSSGAIANSTFDGNGANGHAADICIDENSVVSLYNLTITNTKASESSIYVDDSNITINKSKFSNWQSDNAIVVNNGNSTVMDTNMTGANAVMVNADAEVHLTNVINDGAQAGDYSVYNNGKLYLNKNNFTNVIVNVGTIETPTTTRILDNDTLVIEIGQDAILNASIVDDNNNTIIVPDFKFLANTTVIDSTNDNKNHYGTYASPAQGVYIISADNLGLNANTIETGVLKVKDPNTSLEVNITQEKQGEIVVIKATVKVNGQAKATGNVTFTINGHQYHATIINTTDLNNQIAVLRLSNLTPDTYFVTATYNGDDTHFGCVNDTELFIVNKRDSNVTVVVDNVVYGNNATAVISSTASNGTVTIYVNGKKEAVVELVNGKYNYDLGKLDSGNYTVTVLYADNTYYTASDNTTTFEVYKYDMDVSVSETQFNQSATITVTLPSDATGDVKIYLNGTELTNVVNHNNGTFTAVTDKLVKVGEYEVNVTYSGDGKYYAREVNGTNFTVTADKDYKFNVTITPENPKYGENVTINVTGPAGQNVTVTIDGENKTVTLDENGTAVITINNLTAGPHSITANVTGNENYTSKEITQTLVINPAVPEMTINVTQPIAPNSPANVTVTVGKNATGTVYIKINDVVTPVEVKDGVAVLPIDTSKPGDYTVTAQFVSDDDNYKSAKNLTGTTYTVDKYNITINSTVNVAPDNHVTVTVNVNGTAKGNVTLTLKDGTTMTVNVTDGVATFDLGIYDKQGDYEFNATFNGDETFNANTVSDGFTVGGLTNYTIDVTVSETQFGDNATVTIKLPEGANGTLTVNINGTEYTGNQIRKVADGIYEIVTPVMPVGDYNVNVTYVGDTRYADQNSTDNPFSVETNSSYPFNVEVITAPYGGNTTINITGPAGENVTVTIDGVNQTVTLNENGTAVITLNNLTAGPHSIVANITGNENYTSKEIRETINIPKQAPDININVTQPIAPNSNVNVTVTIGNNASGKVSITVDNVTTIVDVINGTAVLPIRNAQPGNHSVVVEYYGDDNYNASDVKVSDSFIVDKYNITMTNTTSIAPDNHVIVTVNVNGTAKGNVTLTLNDGTTKTVNVTDGVATFDLGVFDKQGDYNYTAVFNGDGNFNKNSITGEFTIGGLTNYTIDVTVSETQFGDNATVTIKLPEGANGTLTVKVGDDTYTPTINPDGTAVITTPAYPVGTYDINVTYTGDTRYADKNNTENNLTVKTNSSYPFNVEVITAPYGENTTINVTGPAGLNVTVYVDDVPYTVTIGENGTGILKLDNVTAGHHTVKANFTGDDNYTAKEISDSFDIAQQTPDIQVIVPQTPVQPNSTANVTVIVGKNATGRVSVTINGQTTTVDVVNGTAVLSISNIQPGTYNVTAEFYGDGNYKGSSNTTGTLFTVDKYEASITEVTPVVNDDNTVTVTVKLNETATGNVTIEVEGTNYTAKVINGVATVEINKQLANKTYDNLVAVYSGDENYKNTTVNVPSFDVTVLRNFNVTVDITEGKYGENTTITVNVPAGADGNVSVIIDGEAYPATINPDGTATIQVPLGVGNHTIKAVFENSTGYAAKNSTEYKVNIEPQDTYPFNVTVKPAPFGNDTEITVNGPAGMKVNVTVDGEVHTLTIGDNGTATLTLDNLTAGKHDVSIKSEANGNYTANTNSTTFEIPKQTPEMDITISEGRTPDENVTVTVKVGDNATGVVSVMVDGKLYDNVELKDGVAQFNITGLKPNEHTINVKYLGDDNYNASEVVSKDIKMDKYASTVEVRNWERDGDNNVIVSVYVSGDDGNVTIKVGDKTYNATVNDGVANVNLGNLPVEDTIINVSYTGDENYAPANITDVNIPALQIVSYPLPVEVKNITYGGDATVKVTLPEDWSDLGLLGIKVDGDYVDTSDYHVDGNVVTVTIKNPKAGEHAVEVSYEDGKYAMMINETSFTVEKAPVESSDITVSDPIEVGQPLNVTVDLPKDANGTITVDINGTKYVFDVVNGSANISIPKLGNGTYKVNVTYSGDDNYDPISIAKEVTVNKVDPEIKAETSEIKLGEPAIIDVTLPDDATGTVTIKVGNVEKTVPVAGGLNHISVENIPVGENQTVIVTYNGNDKYAKDTITTNLTVKPQDKTSDEFKVDDKGNGTIIVTVPENATGNITLKIGNETYEVPIEDGKAVIDIANETNQTPGVHDVTISYTGDGNNTPVEFNSTANVPKWESEVNVNIPTIREGDIAKVNVTVTSKDNRGYVPNGTVRVEVDGKGYFGELINGNVIVDVPGLGNGTHTVKVTYDGNDYYLSNSTTETATVQEAITVKVNGTGNSSEIVVKLPEDATQDQVEVFIDGKNETDRLTLGENGTAKVNLTGIEPGVHNVTIKYTDEDGTVSYVNTTVNVPKWSSSVNATAATIREGDPAIIKVTVGKDMTGEVKVVINGTGYIADVDENGEATITAYGLKAGEHSAVVTYLGSDKYEPSNATFKLTVQAPITVEVNGTGNGSEVVVKFPEGTTKDQVNVTIDGKDANDRVTIDENGTAKVNLTGIEPGEHNITIKYTDEDGTVSWVNTTVNVPKWSSSVNATAATIREGDPAVIKVKVNPDMQGEVKVVINGTGYIATVDENGEATITAYGLKAGNHTAVVTYLGSDKYEPSNATFKLTVQAPITVEVNGTGNGSEVIVKFPEGTTKDQVNVTIDGKDANDRLTIDENGTAKVNLTGIEPGEHNITIKYTDEDGTVSWVNTTVNVPKWSSAVNATAATIREGDPAVIKVKVSPDMQGEVKVVINGTGYIATVDENGEATITAYGLKAGEHTAVVTYLGSDKYEPSNATFKVTVQEPITVKINGTGNSSEVIVKFPEGTTPDQVNVTIDGKDANDRVTIDKNGTAKVNLTGIEPGEHNITIKYTDEDGTVSWVNTTVNVPKWSSAVNATAATIREGDVAVINVKMDANETGRVLVNINGTGYYADLKDGKAIINAPGLKAGSYNATVSYEGDKKYDSSNNTFTIVVQAPITINVNGTGNSSEVVVQLPEGANETSITITVDGNKTLPVTVDKNGTARANLTGLEPGEHNITVKYVDPDGTVSYVNTTIDVPRWSSAVNATAATIREGDVAVINVQMDANETGRVLVDINGTGYYADLKDGKAIINAPGLKAGTYNATVTYEGDAKYDPSNNTFQIIVQAPITIDVNGTGNSSEVVVKLPEGATDKDVNITVDGNTTLPVTVDENGTARANLTGLEPGEHNITVKYVDPDGTVSYVNTTINVPRWSSAVNATAPTIREGDVAEIQVKVDSNETGTVYVDIDGTGYYGTLENGVVTINAPGIKAGTYTGNVTYLGDRKYDPSNNTFTLTVESAIEIDLEGAGNSSQVVIKLPENGTDNVNVTVDGKQVPVKVENGTAIADLSGLPEGEHNVTVVYTDKDGRQSVVNKTIKIYKSINVADEITRGWNSPYDAEAEFLDKEGHVLANTTVEFTVNGKTYKVKTDDKGIGKLTDSHLAVGKYDLTVKNPVTGEEVTSKLTIVKRLIENKDVTTDYLAGKYYTVKAIGDDGKPVGAGEVIGITVNGVGYVIKTDKNGVGKLKINLVPKKYTLTAEYAKYKVTNKVVVKQTLKLVKKTVKAKKGKKIVIKAKLKWTNGKAIKGKKITIKFKGKKFSAKTNKKGIAKITIKKKSVLKKLKRGKTYKFTAFYVKEKAKGKIKIKK